MQHVILGLFQNPEGCQEGDAGSGGLAGIKMLCHESLVSGDPTLKNAGNKSLAYLLGDISRQKNKFPISSADFIMFAFLSLEGQHKSMISVNYYKLN